MKYWYKFFICVCFICGKDASYKIRQYTKKPKQASKRYKQLSQPYAYCGCLDR